MAAKRRIETMEENRAKLIAAARKAFARDGYAEASMDELTASVGLTRGALYHNFADKRGLLSAVVNMIDGEMAARAQAIGARAGGDWQGLLAEGVAYIEMALDPEVQRIVLLDGPAVLGDPSQWPSQSHCLQVTKQTVERLISRGILKPIDAEAAEGMLAEADSLEAEAQQAGSFAGRIGTALQPAFAPLGADRTLTVAILTSFLAREVFVSTVAVLEGGGPDAAEDEHQILDLVRRASRDDGTPLFNPATAASMLVFFVLAMQCLPTLAVTKRETGSWKWPALQFAWMTVLAWTAAAVVHAVVSSSA